MSIQDDQSTIPRETVLKSKFNYYVLKHKFEEDLINMLLRETNYNQSAISRITGLSRGSIRKICERLPPLSTLDLSTLQAKDLRHFVDVMGELIHD